jgi:hypothetical protein
VRSPEEAGTDAHQRGERAESLQEARRVGDLASRALVRLLVEVIKRFDPHESGYRKDSPITNGVAFRIGYLLLTLRRRRFHRRCVEAER